jgi:hypothetical protein
MSSDVVVMTTSVAADAEPGHEVHASSFCVGQNGVVPAEMLVGRRLAVGALQAVDAAGGGAGGGAGGVALLAGEAGMGKTALASEAVAYAKARGAAAVWGTC